MSNVLAPFQLLELNVISAQDLAPVARNMRTYAVAWVHPDRKLSTRVDTQGHTNPTWNDKFVFRVDEDFLYEDTSAIMIEIFALHWFKDIHVGTVRVLVGNLIPPPSRPFQNNDNRPPLGMRFVALQVRRASGRPQGILNIGVAVLDSSMRSMPLYTLNSSAVGYRHLMGEKDAYDNHNHLSPHRFHAGAGTKPDLRRTKSDTSSMVGSEAVARQRVIANMGKASSVVSGSEVSNKSEKKKRRKKKGKRRSKNGSSILSGSTLSDSVLRWKLKNHRKTSETQGEDSELNVQVEVEPPPPPLDTNYHNNNNINQNESENEVVEHNEVVNVDNNVDQNENKTDSSVISISEAATSDINEKILITNNNVYDEVKASPKPHFHNSPAPQFHNSPARQFHNSPGPKFHNSPAPKFRNSPAPHYIKSPAPQYIKSPAPAPQYIKSPAPHYIKSPAPAPQYIKSPAPQFIKSPAVASFKNSPKPQFMNSPKPQFRNSPVVGPQFRSSPAVSKFNPAVGFGGSNRGTPMHPFGRLNGAFDQYGTPRRSNLGNMGPPVVTESELGPSPSEVAAAMARKPAVEEGENSTVGGWSLDESVEGLQSKLERWRTELPPVIDNGEFSSFPTSSTKTSRHSRRHTDGGGNGLFSCFSNICGIECSIVCGGDPKGKKNNHRRRSSSADNASLQ